MNGVPAILMGVSTGVVINLGDKGSLSVSSDSGSFMYRFFGGDKVVVMAISAVQLISRVNLNNLCTIRSTSSRRI